MQGKSALTTACGIFIGAIALWAQGPAAPAAPWRGVGPTPCRGLTAASINALRLLER